MPASRRDVIAGSALAAAALSLAPHVRAAEEAKKKLGVAVVGIGSLSKNQLLPALKKTTNCRLAAIVTGHPQEKGPMVVEKFGLDPKKVYTYDNYDAALKNDPDVDVVYVVLPNSMHAEYTIRAFKAGKHVLCEKPMANTPDECRQMIDAGKAAGKQLMIAYRLRYEPFNTNAIRLLRSGELGALKHIEAGAAFVIGDPAQWRLNRKLSGGGSMMDIGIYALNACRYLSGEDPAEVSAMSFSTPNDPRFKEVEETIVFDLRFPSGLLATCTSSYGFGINRYRATCTRGVVEMDPFLSYGGLRQWVRKPGMREKEAVQLEQADHFASEMDAFAKAIQSNTPIATPGEEGLADMKVIAAIYQAAETGKTVKVG